MERRMGLVLLYCRGGNCALESGDGWVEYLEVRTPP